MKIGQKNKVSLKLMVLIHNNNKHDEKYDV